MGVLVGPRANLPLHPAEKKLLFVVGANLCFLPWALGTMHPWSQISSFSLSTLGLAVALHPRDYVGSSADGNESYRLVLWPKLVRFPIFWMGLALLLLVLVQAANSSWRYVQTSKAWWLVRTGDVWWMPGSVKVPSFRFNIWWQFVIYSAVWMLVCSIWVGLTRRRSLRVLLGVIVANGLALGILLAFQRVTDNHYIPWPLTALTRNRLMASFISANHAGAYFTLTVFCAIALATWFFDDGKRSLAKSTPSGVFGFAALVLGGAVFFTLSRGASLTLVVVSAVFAGWIALRRNVRPNAIGVSPVVITIILVGFIFSAYVATRNLEISDIYNRWESIAVHGTAESSVRTRAMARAAATTMLHDHWLRGVGAGCFRYLFPEYVKLYPEIYEGSNLFWEHAHCDWLEIPIELGLIGDLILVLGLGWWVRYFIRHRVLWHPLAMPALIGCLPTLIHACFDFPFQCPAILATWCVMITMAGKWVEIDDP